MEHAGRSPISREAESGDRRDELSINLTNGIMFIKKLQNGLYKETATKLENLVNEINF